METQQAAAIAENFIGDYLRRQLEHAGHSEAAASLDRNLQAKLEKIETSGGLTTCRFAMEHRVSEYRVKLNAFDGDLMGWQFPLLGLNSSNGLPNQTLLAAAERAASPPPNAVLATAEYEEMGGNQVFVAHWSHAEDGVPVENDYIHVLVNGRTGRVFALHRRWHEVNYAFTER